MTTTAGDATASSEVGTASQQQQQLPPAPIYGQRARQSSQVYSELPPAPIYGSASDAYGANANPYVGVPPPLPPLPPPAMSSAAARSSGGGGPPWLWIGLGVVLATVYQKVTGFVKGGGAQQAAANMMMQQMMKQAAKQGGGGAGAAGFPGFPPPGGMPPGFGFPPPGGAGAPPSPFGPGAFDTTATSAPGGAGSKFEAVRAREEAARAAAASAGSTSTSTSSPSSSASSSSSADAAAKRSSFSAFKDVADEPSSVSEGGNGASTSSGGSGEEAAPKKKISSDLLDGFFRDPSIQQMFYQHLPEEMRNPETFEWILSNPEYVMVFSFFCSPSSPSFLSVFLRFRGGNEVAGGRRAGSGGAPACLRLAPGKGPQKGNKKLTEKTPETFKKKLQKNDKTGTGRSWRRWSKRRPEIWTRARSLGGWGTQGT